MQASPQLKSEPTPKIASIGIHCLHDSSVAFIDKDNCLRVFEFERFAKVRNCSLAAFPLAKRSVFPSCGEEVKHAFLECVKAHLKEYPDVILCSGAEWDVPCTNLLKEHFPKADLINMGHHLSHCASGFAFSGYTSALALSLDGGGYEPSDQGGQYVTSSYSVHECYQSSYQCISATNTGVHGRFTPGIYGCLAYFISEIAKAHNALKEPVPVFLPYAGKLMGLVGYGSVRPHWIAPLKEFYKVHPELAFTDQHLDSALRLLAASLDIPLSSDCLAGKESYDLAATNQYVFEELCLDLIQPFLNDCSLDVVFTGGCALNVLFNQKLQTRLNAEGRKFFVPPNPGDEGLSLGHLVAFDRGTTLEPSVYCGLDIPDLANAPIVASQLGFKTEPATPERVVGLLIRGKIGALMMGRSEIGPRALGNRSIVCDPSFRNAKDNLNARVKFREWFRPFAPVCREEDKDRYFVDAVSSPYMSFSPTVRQQFRGELPGIVHVDGTARLQTVSRESHSYLYKLLTQMAVQGHSPILLNTSLNIKGKPILTAVEDALEVLCNTELDFLVVEELLIVK